MKAFRVTFIVLRNELKIGIGKPTIQETVEYLINHNVIGPTKHNFITWLESWGEYLLGSNSPTIKERIQKAQKGITNI